MSEIYGLNKEPSWVGAPMLLSVRQPSASIYNIVSRLLKTQPLKQGEEYEFIPIELEEKSVLKAHSPTLLPKRKLSQ